MKIKHRIVKIIYDFFDTLGYEFYIGKKDEIINPDPDKVRINIGAGNWGAPGWTNLDFPSETYKVAQSHHSFIPYDIRNDNLPYDDGQVDMVYCSHVIEHIETFYIEKLVTDVHRVLKSGGVFRIACPDAEFLYNMAKCGKEYYAWRKQWFDKRGIDWDRVRPVDLLVRETATPKLKDYGWMNYNHDYQEEFDRMEMNRFFEFMCNDIPFNVENVNNHINWWSFDRLSDLLRNAGFTIVERSKYGGSVCSEMQDTRLFDTTHPEMSLYIDAIK